MDASVGGGLLTVKVCVALAPPPGPPFVTERLFGPVAAAAVIVMVAVICVGLSNVVFGSGPPAGTFTARTPAMNPVPVNTTSSVCRRFPTLGAIDVSVAAGLLTVKALVMTPPPGAGLVTVKLRGPGDVPAGIVMFAVI